MALPSEEVEEFEYEGATMPSMTLGTRSVAWHIISDCMRALFQTWHPKQWIHKAIQSNATQHSKTSIVRNGEVGPHHIGRTKRPSWEGDKMKEVTVFERNKEADRGTSKYQVCTYAGKWKVSGVSKKH